MLGVRWCHGFLALFFIVFLNPYKEYGITFILLWTNIVALFQPYWFSFFSIIFLLTTSNQMLYLLQKLPTNVYDCHTCNYVGSIIHKNLK